MINVGDWIRMIEYPDVRGYVNKINAYPTEYIGIKEPIVHFLRQCNHGVYTQSQLKLSLVELEPIALHNEDISALIDLALATNDRGWFEELTRGMVKHATN